MMNNKIMQRFLVILFCQSFIVHSISGQDVFNNVYEIQTSPAIRNVITVDSGYIIAGGHFNPNTSVIIGYVDLQGNLVSYKSYGDSIYNWYHGLEGSFIKTSDGGFALAGSKTIGGLLFKFDHNLDTLWKKEYIFPTQTLFYGCAETESGYALVGLQTENNGQFDQMILVKTDNEGNYLWHKLFGGIYEDAGFKIIKTFDGGFLLGGSSNSFNPQVEPGDAGDWYLVKTDSLGNMQWQKHFGNPEIDDGMVGGMIQTYDSCYIITGAYSTEFYSLYDHYRRPRIMKIDQSGNIIWDKKYGEQSDYPWFSTIIENENNTLVCIGKNIMNKNILIKLTSDGMIRWVRHFLMYNSNDGVQDLEYINHANDGGYIIVGWGLVSGHPQEAWIVKTDSLGCDGFQSCQDTALAMHVWPGQITVVEGSSLTIKTYIDNGKGPVTVSYSTGETHYPVYLSYPDATDSIVYYPAENTVVHVTASYGNNPGVMDSAIIHVITGIEENMLNGEFEVFPNPAKDFINIKFSNEEFIPGKIEFLSSQNTLVKSIYPAKKELLRISVNDMANGVYYLKACSYLVKLVVVR